jgi:hypothetical protein
MQMNKSFN